MKIVRFVDDVHLQSTPVFQIAVGVSFLIPVYRLTNLDIVMEGIEHIPDTPVIFAMNHTDRYNYWPFQFQLWNLRKKYGIEHPYVAVWVKGKYYENPFMACFMKWAGNIPVPSKGYLVASDFVATYGKRNRLSDDDFRLLKGYIEGEVSVDELRESGDKRVFALVSTAHGDFDPSVQSYRDYINGVFYKLMERVREANYEAVHRKGLNLIIFPEGKRSKKLVRGKPGVAQMALSLKVPVVPVGCNGSDKVYPGNMPIPKRNGRVIYRIGEPIVFEKVSEKFKISNDFVPFTPQSDRLKGIFREATDMIMGRIYELLDEEYRGDYLSEDSTSVSSFI